MGMILTFDTTIDELIQQRLISVRTHNVCRNNNLLTIEDLRSYFDKHSKSFLGLRNCGRKSCFELSSVLDKVNPVVVAKDKIEIIDLKAQQIFIDEYEMFICNPSIDEQVKSLFQIEFPDVNSFFNMCLYDSNRIISKIIDKSEFSERTIYFFRLNTINTIQEISRQIKHQLPENDEFVQDFISATENISEIFKSRTLSEYCRYVISDSKRVYLEHEFSLLVRGSSRLSQCISESDIKTMYDLLPLIYLSSEGFIGRFGGKRKRANEFYKQVALPFSVIFDNVLYSDVDEKLLEIIARFPFLSKASIDVVKGFFCEHSYFPMFYIVCEFLTNSKVREYEMFCLKYGLNEEHKMYSLFEIGKRYNITRERVRQILTLNSLKKEPFLKSEFWDKYKIDDVLITEASSIFKDIHSFEVNGLSFDTFAQIFTILFDYTYNDEAELKFICSKKYYSVITTLITSLTNAKNRKYATDTYVKLNDILPEAEAKKKKLRTVAFGEVARMLSIETYEETFFFPQNFVDVENEAYKILYEKGEPIHIDELTLLIKEQFSDFNLCEESIKNKIRLSTIIRPIGKTSMQKLNLWRNVFDGSIRDLIRKIMTERITPISLDELTSLVTDVFENTNRKNIHSNLASSDEFISFANGLYGLKGKSYSEEFVEVDLSKTRRSFEDRFEQFKNFVKEFMRIPYASGADEEDSLYRWYNNVLNGVLDVSEEQRNELLTFLEKNKDIPKNGTELRFKRICQDYLDYVRNNFELPTHKSCTSLYNWMNKVLPNYAEFEDNRKMFFEELLEELKSFGFYLL